MLFIVTMSLVSANDEVNNETVIADGIVGTSLVADGVQIANDVNVDELTIFIILIQFTVVVAMDLLIFMLRIPIIHLLKIGLRMV